MSWGDFWALKWMEFQLGLISWAVIGGLVLLYLLISWLQDWRRRK